jgi:hypothetical protein
MYSEKTKCIYKKSSQLTEFLHVIRHVHLMLLIYKKVKIYTPLLQIIDFKF